LPLSLVLEAVAEAPQTNVTPQLEVVSPAVGTAVHENRKVERSVVDDTPKPKTMAATPAGGTAIKVPAHQDWTCFKEQFGYFICSKLLKKTQIRGLDICKCSVMSL
jgi:hypothetical protein